MSYIAQRFYDKAQVVLETAQSRLPKIANLPNYNYYVESLNKHLHEAIHKKELKFTVRPDMD